MGPPRILPLAPGRACLSFGGVRALDAVDPPFILPLPPTNVSKRTGQIREAIFVGEYPTSPLPRRPDARLPPPFAPSCPPASCWPRSGISECRRGRENEENGIERGWGCSTDSYLVLIETCAARPPLEASSKGCPYRPDPLHLPLLPFPPCPSPKLPSQKVDGPHGLPVRLCPCQHPIPNLPPAPLPTPALL